MIPKERDGGWVVEAKSSDRIAPRFFLVSATGPAQALALVQMNAGIEASALTVRGPVDATHLQRRNMQLGDVEEIVAQRRAPA